MINHTISSRPEKPLWFQPRLRLGARPKIHPRLRQHPGDRVTRNLSANRSSRQPEIEFALQRRRPAQQKLSLRGIELGISQLNLARTQSSLPGESRDPERV